MNRVMRFWNDDAGASAAEYAMLLGIIGAAIVIGAIQLGDAVGTSINGTATCIGTNGGTCIR